MQYVRGGSAVAILTIFAMYIPAHTHTHTHTHTHIHTQSLPFIIYGQFFMDLHISNFEQRLVCDGSSNLILSHHLLLLEYIIIKTRQREFPG